LWETWLISLRGRSVSAADSLTPDTTEVSTEKRQAVFARVLTTINLIPPAAWQSVFTDAGRMPSDERSRSAADWPG